MLSFRPIRSSLVVRTTVLSGRDSQTAVLDPTLGLTEEPRGVEESDSTISSFPGLAGSPVVQRSILTVMIYHTIHFRFLTL